MCIRNIPLPPKPLDKSDLKVCHKCGRPADDYKIKGNFIKGKAKLYYCNKCLWNEKTE